MYCHAGCRRCRARATGLLQMGPPGLAWRLQSRKARAWDCTALLLWRAQCHFGVYAALTAGRGRGLLASPPPVVAVCPARLSRLVRSVRVSRALASWYAIPCGLRAPRSSSGCPFGKCRVCFVCPCALAPLPLAPPPTRAPCKVPSQGASRALPCGSRSSAIPARVPILVSLRGGGGLVVQPLCHAPCFGETKFRFPSRRRVSILGQDNHSGFQNSKFFAKRVAQ